MQTGVNRWQCAPFTRLTRQHFNQVVLSRGNHLQGTGENKKWVVALLTRYALDVLVKTNDVLY